MTFENTQLYNAGSASGTQQEFTYENVGGVDRVKTQTSFREVPGEGLKAFVRTFTYTGGNLTAMSEFIPQP